MAPLDMRDHAIDNLRFIRETMERASTFTAVPGRGVVAMGVSALAAAALASRQPTPERWLAIWIAEVALAVMIGGFFTFRKVRASRAELQSRPARKFALAFAPPLLFGGVMTLALWRAGSLDALPGVWLGLYGVAVIGAGAYSVRIVPAMGAVFVAAGMAALFAPAAWADVCLAVGFGLIHIVFGAWIARRHGG